MRTHKDLDVWKKSIDLVKNIYDITGNFPKNEMYGIVNQMRRAAVSISSNIAEGAARRQDKEFIRFLYIAQGSLAELETQIIISEKLGFIAENVLTDYDSEIEILRKEIYGLINWVKRKIETKSE